MNLVLSILLPVATFVLGYVIGRVTGWLRALRLFEAAFGPENYFDSDFVDAQRERALDQ